MALLVRGGGRIVTLLSGPPLCPLPFRPGLTPFTVLKSTICITQQSGSERQGDMGQEEERKIGEEKGDDGVGGTAGKGDRTRGICLGVELSVGKYLSNSFHIVKASLLLPSLQTLCLLIFLPPCFTDSFNFYFPMFCNPLRGFPTLWISPLQVFSDNPKSLFPWPASLIAPPFPLSTPLFWVHPSSCCGVARAFQGHVWGRRIFPMGPQVKTRTRSVRRGTPSVPVAALARGDPCHPSSFQSINPTPQFMRSPSLLCFGEPCWITRNVSHSPSQRNPSTFLLAHSPCISSLIYPWLPFHFPPTSSPTLPLFCFTSTHITCFSLHL